MKEFNLSEKMKDITLFTPLRAGKLYNILLPEDVREFIKRLKEVIDPRIVGAVCCVDMLEEIDKLAGDDLNGS